MTASADSKSHCSSLWDYQDAKAAALVLAGDADPAVISAAATASLSESAGDLQQ